MEYARLETAKLGEVDDSYYYGASCGKCNASRLCLLKLRAYLGDAFPLVKVRARLAASGAAHAPWWSRSWPARRHKKADTM